MLIDIYLYLLQSCFLWNIIQYYSTSLMSLFNWIYNHDYSLFSLLTEQGELRWGLDYPQSEKEERECGISSCFHSISLSNHCVRTWRQDILYSSHYGNETLSPDCFQWGSRSFRADDGVVRCVLVIIKQVNMVLLFIHYHCL